MKPDYFPVFPMHLLMDEDYELLTRDEWGSVFLLMQHQWVKDGTLPEDRTKLAGMARCTLEQLDALLIRWPKLEAVEDQPGRVAIPWLYKEYVRAMSAWEDYREKQAEKGRRSGISRGTVVEPEVNRGSTTVQPRFNQTGTTDEPPSHPIPSHPLIPEAIASGSSEPQAPPEPPVATFPCVGKGEKQYHVTKTQLDEWKQCFPALDVMQELRGAYAWLKAKPENRKTAKGMPQFIVSWLSRSQNTGGARASPTAAGPTRSPAARAGRDAEFVQNLQAVKAKEREHGNPETAATSTASTGAETLL